MSLSVSFSLGVKEVYFSILFFIKRDRSIIVLNELIVLSKLEASSLNSKTALPLSSISLKMIVNSYSSLLETLMLGSAFNQLLAFVSLAKYFGLKSPLAECSLKKSITST